MCIFNILIRLSTFVAVLLILLSCWTLSGVLGMLDTQCVSYFVKKVYGVKERRILDFGGLIGGEETTSMTWA